MESKNEFRIPGIPRAAVEQEEDRRTRLVGGLVHQVFKHPNTDVLIVDGESHRTCDRFSEQSNI